MSSSGFFGMKSAGFGLLAKNSRRISLVSSAFRFFDVDVFVLFVEKVLLKSEATDSVSVIMLSKSASFCISCKSGSYSFAMVMLVASLAATVTAALAAALAAAFGAPVLVLVVDGNDEMVLKISS